MIFDPLGMADSTVATQVYAGRKDRAVGHEKGYASVPLKTPLIPSGGVYTSARDMADYLTFHLNHGHVGGKSLLQESLWQDMHGFSLGGDYGLGVIRTELRYGNSPIRVLNHRGGGFGFGCVFSYCPQAQLAWAAMFNRPTAAPYQFGAGLLDALLTRRYGARARKAAAGLADHRAATTSARTPGGKLFRTRRNRRNQVRRRHFGDEAQRPIYAVAIYLAHRRCSSRPPVARP